MITIISLSVELILFGILVEGHRRRKAIRRLTALVVWLNWGLLIALVGTDKVFDWPVLK